MLLLLGSYDVSLSLSLSLSLSPSLSVDATKDNNRLGRLLNHSRANPNVYTKLYDIDDQPYLCLLAAREIETGEELEYDYGERKKDIMEAHQWLKNS